MLKKMMDSQCEEVSWPFLHNGCANIIVHQEILHYLEHI